MNRFKNMGTAPVTDEDWTSREFEVLELFSPGAPIDEARLFAGRSKQIERLIEAVFQRGQHAILYGERGVGKSSLANTFHSKLLAGRQNIFSIPINCHPSDHFSDVWRKVFKRMFLGEIALSDRYQGAITPDDVVTELSTFKINTVPIIILDEFDKLGGNEVRNLIANTIKNLSDRSVRATVILVGVADSVGELIDEHESVLRCLRQIPIQRMFSGELKEIVSSRLAQLAMTIDSDVIDHVAALSRGLPHYTHLFGQRSALKALQGRSVNITFRDVESALPECIEQIDLSVRKQYHLATMSPRKGNIYEEVLLAAALAEVDEFGYFAPADLKRPLSALLDRDTLVSLFGQHLKKLCDSERGAILEQIGTERKYRYRFVEPMMQPFVLLNGRRNELISRDQVDELAPSETVPSSNPVLA